MVVGLPSWDLTQDFVHVKLVSQPLSNQSLRNQSRHRFKVTYTEQMSLSPADSASPALFGDAGSSPGWASHWCLCAGAGLGLGPRPVLAAAVACAWLTSVGAGHCCSSGTHLAAAGTSGSRAGLSEGGSSLQCLLNATVRGEP